MMVLENEAARPTSSTSAAAEAVAPGDEGGHQGENQRAHQGYQGGFAQQAEEFLRRQVEAEQEQQKYNPDPGDVPDQFGVGDQRQAPRPEDGAQREVRDQHRLAQVERDGRQHGGAAEDQEQRKYH